ncbi:hypothetical protein E3N88_42033 [Mikania micrantha]|uniref:CCDC93 coiled-coil domain-containing protein n=1 Tax=Mikania micrantha TaxID=192012 RepID=A0A5N6LIY2_9ASTR|nr:hypothetical protein E3N88_42033 [Mikania micrantha]
MLQSHAIFEDFVCWHSSKDWRMTHLHHQFLDKWPPSRRLFKQNPLVDPKNMGKDASLFGNRSTVILLSKWVVLASKLREITSLKRQHDDMPTQAELMQYEHRFSELNVHIQGKLRQTRNYYATFNALLEIKELMLKETSLLNSLSSQFHDALSTPAGIATLTSSMDGISKSIQQKLQNVQVTLQSEQKVCDSLKKKHAAANLDKRRYYLLLKAFQEECTRNARLLDQSKEIHM